jgi:hypothetical protein
MIEDVSEELESYEEAMDTTHKEKWLAAITWK